MPECGAGILQLSPRHLALLRELLLRHVPSSDVWAYGSRVTGQGHAASDLDLVVRNPRHPDIESNGLAALRAALSESNLPLRVDIVDWARIPESFQQEIEAAYVVVQSGESAGH
ncbi:MAG: nucleotidyltransferase domain-containing protein [Desulfuromonadales bacterium]|nr:nucleotidyltransferase domain-containing protein [Desulfuromonadales bacterium]